MKENMVGVIVTAEMAIGYFKNMRRYMCDEHLKICPRGTVAYYATLKEKELYDMAIKALEEIEGAKEAEENATMVIVENKRLCEENKGLKKELEEFQDSLQKANATNGTLITDVVQLREERAKLKEKLLFLEPKAELEKEELQRKIQKAREELQSYTGVEVSGVETIPKVHVLAILDKYLGGDTNGSHE